MGYRHFLPFFNVVASDNEKYYPETMGNTAVVNAPAVFPFFWRIVRPWLDEFTAAKVRVLTAAHMPLLKDLFHQHALPAVYGGTDRTSIVCTPSRTPYGPHMYTPSHTPPSEV